MNIIYITSRLPYGPGEAFIYPEINQFISRGHHITIVPMLPQGKMTHISGKHLIHNSMMNGLFSIVILSASVVQMIFKPIKVVTTLWKILHNSKGKVALKNIVVFPKGLWLSRIAERNRIDHIHVHWASTTATLGLIASELTSIPWSFTAHRWDIVENNLLEIKMRHAKFARFISQSGIELARKYVSEAAMSRAIVLHMGSILQKRNYSLSNQETKFTIMCPANLIRVKGHTYLIRATNILMQRGYELEVLLAGDGELRVELEKQIETLGLENVIKFLGHVPHEDLMNFYECGNISCTVLPSVNLGCGEQEGIPVSLIEAMSYGVPVISTFTGGIRELLDNGSGVLVPPSDPIALADALERLMVSSEFRSALSLYGQKKVETDFNIHNIVSQLEQMFS